MADAVLIDSATGQSFSRAALNNCIEEWKTSLTGSFSSLPATQFGSKQYILVALPKSAATVIACLVTEAMGCAFVLSDFSDLKSIVDRVKPAFAFVDHNDVSSDGEGWATGLDCAQVQVDLDTCTIVKSTASPNKDYAADTLPSDDVRYITFSSGSTGRPKGIFGSHRCVRHMNDRRNELFPYRPVNASGRWVVAVNIFLLWECFRPLDFNGTCVVIRQEDFVDPDRFIALVEKYEINELLFTSSYARLFLANRSHSGKKLAPSCVRRVWQNGEPVTETLRESFLAYFNNPDCEVLNLYSISECYEVGHGNLRESNTKLRLFPEVAIAVDPESGEVVAHTPTITGYHKPQGDEMKVFDANFKWYRTGDRGRILQRDGKPVPENEGLSPNFPLPESSSDLVFELYGRCTNFVRVKGRFVSLEQIQGAVEKGLKLDASIEIDAQTQEVIAYVDGKFEPDGIQAVRGNCSFPEWMPDRFVQNTKTPRLPSASGKAATASTPGEKMRNVLFQFLGVDVSYLTKPKSLRDLGVTSLSILRLREALLSELGLDISIADLYRVTDVRSFTSETVTPAFIQDEARGVMARVKANVASFNEDNGAAMSKLDASQCTGYFVTGSTGYLGGWVTDAIAKRGITAPVFLLVRKSDAECREIFAKKGLTLPQNVVFLKGDISQPNFGLSTETVIEQVLPKVKYYYHCAAHVVFGCSYAEAKPSTVNGCQNMMTLYGRSPRHLNAQLHYVSTNGVYPPYFTETFEGRPCKESQEDFDLYLPKLKEGYGWSKWVAEKVTLELCRGATSSDPQSPTSAVFAEARPLRIYRPGNIGWSLDGRYNPNDFQTLMLFAFRTLQCYPDNDTWNFEMTPVDELARFMLDNQYPSTTAPQFAPQQTVHNIIGKRVKPNEYCGASPSGETIRPLPLCEWNDKARTHLKGLKEEETRSRDNDAVQQTLASFEEFVTLDMYLSDSNDYFTENSLCYQPTKAYMGVLPQ